MRTAIVMLMILAVAGSAVAQDLGSTMERPVKNAPTQTYVSPEVARQGGDTIFDATVIPGIPFYDSGSTEGYVDDYDEICPYSNSTAPDVVYSFASALQQAIHVDLCGSSYDTKLYIYDSNLTLVACNDDFYFDDYCGNYVSKLEFVLLEGGETYYIVIDGYGSDFGEYELNVTDTWDCNHLECPADAVDEGEPPLQDGYVDAFNGGCNSEDLGAPFQEINWTNDADGYPPFDGVALLCGISGWYISLDGTDSRDTDWFRVFARETGTMEFTVDAEEPCFMYKLAPLDCGEVAVELETVTTYDTPGTLSFPVVAGEEIWLWVGPTAFSGYVNEFIYIMTVSNNEFDVVPTEGVSWGGVKALYR
jgi:hypothetical protein